MTLATSSSAALTTARPNTNRAKKHLMTLNESLPRLRREMTPKTRNRSEKPEKVEICDGEVPYLDVSSGRKSIKGSVKCPWPTFFAEQFRPCRPVGSGKRESLDAIKLVLAPCVLLESYFFDEPLDQSLAGFSRFRFNFGRHALQGLGVIGLCGRGHGPFHEPSQAKE